MDRRRVRGGLGLVCLASVAGCATDSCGDPARAGLLDGISNLVSGCYVSEEARLEAQLKAAGDRRARLGEAAAAADARASALDGQLAESQRRLAEQQRALADASVRLDRARAAASSRMAELATLRATESELTLISIATGEQAPQNVDAGEVERLAAATDLLRRRIDDFLGGLGDAT